jgi:hypothetical protein
MQQIRLDETDFTTILAGSLNEYVKKITGKNLPAPSTPHSTRQSYKNLDKSSCFDLIQRLSESSLLILEVKITDDGIRLRSFNSQQRKIDAALRAVGIPIEYCYNIKDDYLEINIAEYTLYETMTSHPVNVSDDDGYIHEREQHLRLKSLVDKLIESKDGNAGMIGALFSKGLISKMRDLNIKALFFAANGGELNLYSDSEIFDIYKSYEMHVKIGGGIDLNSATYNQLVSEFQASALKLRQVLNEWSYTKDQNNNQREIDPYEFTM